MAFANSCDKSTPGDRTGPSARTSSELPQCTTLHGFLPFPHIDHLHPDWGIALAASANGREKMEEFNHRFDHHLIQFHCPHDPFDQTETMPP